MTIQHKDQTTLPDGPDASKVSATKWNNPHQLVGGVDGQALVYDSNDPEGGSFAWLIPATPVHDENEIPLGQIRAVDIGVSPNRLIGWGYNDNGTVLFFGTITV